MDNELVDLVMEDTRERMAKALSTSRANSQLCVLAVLLQFWSKV